MAGSSALTVAVIGCGRMGGPIADNIIRAGHDVRVVDIVPERLAERVALGGTAAATPAAAMDGADVACIIVFDDTQVEEVLNGPDGLLRTARPGTHVVVHSSVAPQYIQRFAEQAEAAGVHLLDGGISGGEGGARAGTLVTMVGGTPEAFAATEPVLASFSSEVIHVGALGSGMSLKLARNLAGYLMMSAVHEAMALAHRAGVDLDLLQRVVRATNVDGQAFSTFGLGAPVPLGDDATARAREYAEHTLTLAEKDLAQALLLASALHVDLPVSHASHDSFDRVLGLASDDEKD